MKRAIYRYFDGFRIFYHGPLSAVDIALYSTLTFLVIVMVAIFVGMIILVSTITPIFLYVFGGLIVFYFLCWLVAKWLNT